MSRIIKGNELAIQSYIFTTAKYDFTVYEKRIMYRLIELAQDELNGVLIRDNMHKIRPTLFGREITMPVRDILNGEEDKNHSKAKEAFKSLATKGIEYEDDKIWSFTNIITSPKITKGTMAMATFFVYDAIWQCLLDFSKGYRKYELVTAMSFKSVYAMRMYEFMSGQKMPIPRKGYISYQDLRKRFNIDENQYKLIGDFKKRVLDKAKKELDEKSPYSFTYKEEMEGRKIVGFQFFPIYQPEKESPSVQEIKMRSKVTARLQISSEIYDFLRYSFEFNAAEINKNKKTIIDGEQRIPDFLGFLASLLGPSRRAKNSKGYVINAIKQKIQES